MNNSFQAKATLESIIGNYKGDQALINEAKSKLDKLQNDELKKSKIQTIAPSDSIILEQEPPTNK
jgi:hypothetical protein